MGKTGHACSAAAVSSVRLHSTSTSSNRDPEALTIAFRRQGIG